MIKKRLKNKTGQVAIFVLMMFSLIFMFFGMAINIGMLVHHKINLQNAADMGALAAAAEQARILNMIGWKNYELRKNFKDFIYRYWVGFNDRHEAFPDPRSAKRRGNLARQGKWTDVMNTIPSYCFGDSSIFEPKPSEGFIACEVSERKGVPAKIIGPLPALIAAVAIEPISATLLTTLYLKAFQLTEETRGNWENYTRFNVNSAFTEVAEYQRRSIDIYNTYLNPVRKNTLSEILNRGGREIFPETPPTAWLNFANENAGFNPNRRPEELRMDHYVSPLFEVPVDYDELAQITVLNNLNENLQERLNIIPLRPQNGYINIRPIIPSFDVFYTTFNIRNDIMRPKRDNPIQVEQFIVGVEKDPNIKTFYSLMVKSQPELPFLPGLMPWELTAVAAAQPFGSRIGPAGNANDYTMPTRLGRRIPMIRIDEERTIDDTQVLHDLKVATATLEHTVQNRDEPILVPNEWDKRRYIFPDPTTKKDPSPVHFSDQVTTIETGAYPAARGSLFTSFRQRAGYSMKLVPIESIIEQLEPVVQEQLKTIKH